MTTCKCRHGPSLAWLVIAAYSLTAATSSTFHQRQPRADHVWGKPKDSAVHNLATNTSSLLLSSPNNSTPPSTVSTIPRWKQSLPYPLSQRTTLQRILIPNSPTSYVQVYLLGTSHVSNDSCADVKLLLEHLHPDVVFLELCEQRMGLLAPSTDLDTFQQNDNTTISFWQKVKLVQDGAERGMTKANAMGTVLLTSVQENYASSLGVEVGSEFRVAYQYCLARRNQMQQPMTLILGDRPLSLTLLRAWESLSWFGKTKVLGGLIWSMFQKPNPKELREWMEGILAGNSDLLTESIADLRKHFPSLERVILKERDAYMACKLYQMCRYLSPTLLHTEGRNYTVVAIVGAGHGPGITDWLTNGNGETPEHILQGLVETKKWRGDMVKSLITEVTELPIPTTLQD